MIFVENCAANSQKAAYSYQTCEIGM